jgi:hypothetical protein
MNAGIRPARIALGIVVLVSIVRIVAAYRLPFDHDEAYYWLWGQQLALSYVDHPPLVAWLARAGSLLGAGPGAARLPFIVCEAVAALAAGWAAAVLADDERAALPATALVLFVPQASFAFGEVSPDAPYVCAWALALFTCAKLVAAARAGERARARRWAVACGAALGMAVLARAFGWALVAGIAAYGLTSRRPVWRNECLVAIAVALALFAPSLIADGLHGWPNLSFTLHGRAIAEGTAAERLTSFYLGRSLAYALVVLALAWAFGRGAARELVRWTALPLTAFLAVSALVQNVLPHWLLGPFVSIAAGAGVAAAGRAAAARGLVAITSLAGCAILAATLFLALPERAIAVTRARVPALRSLLLPDPSFADARLAADLERFATPAGARIMTDYYDVAAGLTYSGADPILTGPVANRSGDVLRRGRDPVVPARVLFVGPATLAADAATSRCAAGYADVRPGPLLAYRWGDAPDGVYGTLWCSDPKPSAAVALYGR